ncbi:MAG: hypothetical protein KDK62_00755 [Chlamydiia bacterium]|nr:hypothetical protein [Chlamydiia bacterium]
MTLDSFGIYGMAADYAMILFFFGLASIAFFYFWWKGRLDMDEESKYQMLNSEESDG